MSPCAARIWRSPKAHGVARPRSGERPRRSALPRRVDAAGNRAVSDRGDVRRPFRRRRILAARLDSGDDRSLRHLRRSIDNGAVVQPVKAPANVVPRFGGLEVTTSSTALQELTDALIYLEQYPYDCAEQVSSRVSWLMPP